MSPGFEVTAVIPAKDALPMVLEAVESARAQTLAPAEIVVVDDGSTDGTDQALAEAAATPGVPVRIVAGRFGSAAAARNAGWRAARTPWIAFLDADDLWFPDKLATAAATLARNDRAKWFFSDGVFRTLEGAERASWLAAYADLADAYIGHPVAELLEVNFVLTSSVVAKRDTLEALGGFDEHMSHAEDLDLWIRLARRAPAAASGRALVRYQHRAGGLTRQVHRRLMGDVELFRRLASDPELPPRLRRRARRRKALAHYKLAFGALREGRRAALWPELREAWMFPERALPVLALGVAGLMPRWAISGLRGRRWAAGGLGRHAFAHARVTLRPEPGLMTETSRGTTP